MPILTRDQAEAIHRDRKAKTQDAFGNPDVWAALQTLFASGVEPETARACLIQMRIDTAQQLQNQQKDTDQ